MTQVLNCSKLKDTFVFFQAEGGQMTKNSMRWLTLLLLALAVPESQAARSSHAKKSKAVAPVEKQGAEELVSLPVTSTDRYFHPSQTLTGIGLGREYMTDDDLALRTRHKIDAATFVIMGDPHAVAGAEAILSPYLQKLFTQASAESGFPRDLLESMGLVESWGNPDAHSPSGPVGIMQITARTATKLMGLKVGKQTIACLKPQKPKLIKRATKNHPAEYEELPPKRTKCTVQVDERLIPEKAIPAAAKYLARLTKEYGSTDFAIWAYHSGESRPNKALALAREYGIEKPTWPKLFYGNSPIWRKKLYDLVQDDQRPKKDYGSTYYFTIRRGAELLELYKTDPAQYLALAKQYQDPVKPNERNKNRLRSWYPPQDIKYKSLTDLVTASGKELVVPPQDPTFFSYTLRLEGPGAIGEMDPKNRKYYVQDKPEIVGGMQYIAFETRRLWEEGIKRGRGKKGELFMPLEIPSLIRDLEYQERLKRKNVNANTDVPTHTIAAADISYLHLPAWEAECLKFVLQDLEWDEYLSYFMESKKEKTWHFCTSPAYREFFIQIEQEARQLLA